MCIDVFKSTVGLSYRLTAFTNIMLFKTVANTTKELKNKVFLNLNQYCMHCCVSVKICLCLVLFNTASIHYE